MHISVNNRLMKKVSQIFLSLMLATIFLLSFTGVRLVAHHCFHCETTEINIFSASHHDCCEENKHHHHNENPTNNSCCENLQYSSSNEGGCGHCCSTNSKFVKQDYQLSHVKNVIKIFAPESDISTNVETASGNTCTTEDSIFKNHEKPPHKFSCGREFVIFSHQIKVC